MSGFNVNMTPVNQYINKLKTMYNACPPITKYILLICGISQILSMLISNYYERFANYPMFILRFFEIYRIFTSILVDNNIFSMILSSVLFYVIFSQNENRYGSLMMFYKFIIILVCTNVVYFVLITIAWLISGTSFETISQYSINGFLPLVITLFVYELKNYSTLGSLWSQNRMLAMLLAATLILFLSFSTIASILTGAFFYFYSSIFNCSYDHLTSIFPPILVQLITSSPSYVGFNANLDNSPINTYTQTNSYNPQLNNRNGFNQNTKDTIPYANTNINTIHGFSDQNPNSSSTSYTTFPSEEQNKKTNFDGKGHVLGDV